MQIVPDNPLLDDYIWIKTPGESYGECSCGLADNAGVDSEWEQKNPGAGKWFEAQAEEFIKNGVEQNSNCS